MENINFDFENKEYLFFIKLTETIAQVGIIELDKISKTIKLSVLVLTAENMRI